MERRPFVEMVLWERNTTSLCQHQHGFSVFLSPGHCVLALGGCLDKSGLAFELNLLISASFIAFTEFIQLHLFRQGDL